MYQSQKTQYENLIHRGLEDLINCVLTLYILRVQQKDLV